MSIKWDLMAEPQDGMYDTDITLQLAAQGRYAKERLPTPDQSGIPIWDHGRAVLMHADATNDGMPSDIFKPAPLDHPIVKEGIDLIRLWPEVRLQCARLLITVSPLTIGHPTGHGCACGQFSDDFGWIYVTADDAVGFAEGIVHEMAHWKLRALGIWFENWDDRLLLNHPDERYDSPVRKDILRPMGAVLHGQYSYVHVAQMTLKVAQSRDGKDESLNSWLKVHIGRISEGQVTLRKARWTADGDMFAYALDMWTSRIIEEARPYVG